jgi:hypothetical protein
MNLHRRENIKSQGVFIGFAVSVISPCNDALLDETSLMRFRRDKGVRQHHAFIISASDGGEW